jgi:hypothetical protein
MAVVLRQDENERSVVQVIIEGLHPRERNRLVFCDKPRTYADLDNMCVYARNIAYGDEGYGGERPSPHSTRSPASPAAYPSARVPPVCYFCHKPGHIRRDCRARAAAATPQVPTSSRQAPRLASLSPVSSIRTSPRNFSRPVGHYCRDSQPDILAVTYPALPYVKVQLACGPVEALFDSGAVCSLMSGTVYRNLVGARQYVVTSPSQANCISATGHSFSVECVASCKVCIERYTWKFRFLVVEGLLYPLLLGADFLRRTGLLLDMHEGSAFFRFDPCNKLPLIGRDFRPTATEVCTVTDSVPLPDIHSCFHWFREAKFFTSLDLNSAYHQI